MNDLGLLVRKYSVPFLFTLVGLVILIFGFVKGQGSNFLIAASMIFVAGILSALFSFGVLKPKLVILIGSVFGVVSIALISVSWFSVSDTLKHGRDTKRCMEISKQNLTDIRFLQKVHKEKYGTYIDNWDDLVEFAKTGTMPSIIAKGTVPSTPITVEEMEYLYGDGRAIDNNMTEEEAYRLSKWSEGPRYDSLFAGFVRDTVQVSILKTKFMNKSYVRSREKLDLYPFSADSLPIIPFTKKQWTLEVRDSIKLGDIVGPSIRVEGVLPFAELQGTDKYIKMYFGDLTTFDLEGSWEKE